MLSFKERKAREKVNAENRKRAHEAKKMESATMVENVNDKEHQIAAMDVVDVVDEVSPSPVKKQRIQ